MKLIKTCWLPILISSILGLFLLGSKSYWFDEAYSIFITKSPSFLHQLWKYEPNMWLYYGILSLWEKIGSGDVFYRSLSVIFGVISAPIYFLIGKKLFNEKVGRICSVLLAINLLFVFYMQTARSYTLLLLLTLVSTYSLLELDKKIAYIPLYIISSALSIYAHFFGGLIILSHLLYLPLFKPSHTKKYFLSWLMVLILIFPLLLSPALHSGVVDWIAKPHLVSLIGTLFVLSGDFPPLMILYTLLVGTSTLKVKDKKYGYLLVWLLLPIVTSYIFSIIVKPIYQSVYFIIVLPPFILLASTAIEQIKSRLVANIVLVSMIIFSFVRLFLWYSGNSTFVWVIKNINEDWRRATAYIQSHTQRGDAVIFYGYYGHEAYSYYSASDTPSFIEISVKNYNPGGGDRLPDPDISLIASLPKNHHRTWLVLNRATGEEFNRTAQRKQIEETLSQVYVTKSFIPFYKVDLELFSLE